MDTCFGILGVTTLLIDGVMVEKWGTPRERALLATLLTHPNEVMQLERLAEWTWPSDDPLPQSLSSTFSTYVTRIRRSLAGLPVNTDLHAVNGGYQLLVEKSAIDYHRFRGLIAEARCHARADDPTSAAEVCVQALGLWRGAPLTDLASERANAWRTSAVHNEWLPANILLLESWLRIQHYNEAISLLDELQGHHPQEVVLSALRMSALHGLARGAEATALYLSTARRLRVDGDDHAADYLRQHQDGLLALMGKSSGVLVPREVVAGPPRQLPRGTADFVGRTRQLAELDSAAKSADAGDSLCGVVILDGMAGVGKTALALHWGHRVRHMFPDGTLYANLDGFSDRTPVDQSHVIDDFLIALDHPPTENMSPRYRQMLLSRLMAGRRILVVLDNARNTEHVRELVGMLSSSFVVVTSRLRLSTLTRYTGARRVRVAPMTAEESTALWVRHLGESELDADRTDRVLGLCGGLPLIITMLADQVANRPSAPVDDYVDQIDHRQLITDAGDTGDGSINAMSFFDQSYHALATPERRLFRLLSLCPGPDFSFSVACACDGRTPRETSKSLQILVGAHLVESPDPIGRYRYHDLLAEFAAYRVLTDETELCRRSARERVLVFYLRSSLHAVAMLYPSPPPAPPIATEVVVEPVTFDDRDQAKTWFDHERSCLVAAIAQATKHRHHAISWRLADPVATHFDRAGYDSRGVRELAVVSSRAEGDRLAEASTLVGLGMGYLTEAEHQKAYRYLNAALRLVEEEGHDRGRASCLHQLARLEAKRDNNAAALELFRRCLDIAQRSDDLEIQGWTNCRIGHVLRAIEQYDEALEHLHRAVWLAQRSENRSAHADALAGIGNIYRDRGDLDAAMTHCGRALSLAESVPDIGVIATIRLELAEIAVARRQTGVAIDHAGRAVELCVRAGDVSSEARARDVLGSALYADGQAKEAISAWHQAAELYGKADNTRLAGLAHARIRAAAEGAFDVPEARDESVAPSPWVVTPSPAESRSPTPHDPVHENADAYPERMNP